MLKKLNQSVSIFFAVALWAGPQFAFAQTSCGNSYCMDEVFMGPGGTNDFNSTNFTGRASIGDTIVGASSTNIEITNAASDTTTIIDNIEYRIVKWTSSGSINIKKGTLNIEYLVVGGGGGGGTGGGGGGGLLTNIGASSLAMPSSTYNVTVGTGGLGSTGLGIAGMNGTNSSIAGLVVASGGGGGGRYGDPTSGNNGKSGASGGGAAAVGPNLSATGGSSISGQGNNGGNSQSSASVGAGGAGGGGAGSIGGNGTAGAAGIGGMGGNGITNIITGASVAYAGGGGGYGPTPGVGGSGGGGNGTIAVNPLNQQPGTDGLGGGGGTTSDGGDGIVVIRWILNSGDTNTAIGGNTTSTNPELEVILNTSNIDMGVFSPSAASTGSATFSVRSYLANGYVVYTYGTPPSTTGGAQIDPMTTGGTSTPGTEQFGINLVDNSNPDVGTNPTQTPDNTFSFGYVATNYNTANNFRYNVGDAIARSDSSSGVTTYTISYLVNVHPVTTPAGKYTFTQSIVVTPTF